MMRAVLESEKMPFHFTSCDDGNKLECGVTR